MDCSELMCTSFEGQALVCCRVVDRAGLVCDWSGEARLEMPNTVEVEVDDVYWMLVAVPARRCLRVTVVPSALLNVARFQLQRYRTSTR